MKNILVISTTCFSNTDSNGRTLAKLFSEVPVENIAQLYTYGNPDFNVCKNYYRITDGEALRSFVKRKETGEVIQQVNETPVSATNSRKKMKKTPLKLLLREIIWKYSKCFGTNLKKWLRDFSPDVILISAANNAFQINISVKIAELYHIPMIVYSTENYYFKDFNYITRRPSLFYLLYRNTLRNAYRRAEKYVIKGIFNTPMLAELYANEFSYPCKCVFAKSDIDFIPNYAINSNVNPEISYLGNLGVGRHKALLEIADALTKINPNYKLNIYGKIPSEEVKTAFENCKGIDYKGFLSYREVVAVMHSSTLLVHAETNDKFYNKDLKYAFSTKIADSICCGTPFFIYANKALAESDFLIKNNCAFFADTKGSLIAQLRMSLSNVCERQVIVSNAEIVGKKYFTETEEFHYLLEN